MRTPTNSGVMKDQNRKLLLDLVRQRPRSRARLAKETGLTRAAVSQIVDGLLEEGILREAHLETGGVGRSAMLLEIQYAARFAAGVNIRRAGIRVGLVELGGRVVCEHEAAAAGVPAAEALESAAALLLSITRDLSPAALLGIGVCAPGPLDFQTGTLLNPPNFPGWHGVAVGPLLAQRTGLPVRVENVSNARALEEMYFGAARDCSNFILVHVDEGVGSGIVVGDRIYRGHSGLGNELGHTSIRFDGAACDCGNRGCLECYAALSALLANSGFDSWSSLVHAAPHDPRAAQLIEREAEYLGTALVAAFNLFDLERAILAGPIAACPGPLPELLGGILSARALGRGRLSAQSVAAAPGISDSRTAAMPVLHAFYHG